MSNLSQFIQETIATIRPVSRDFHARAQVALNQLTKPVGSLGRLEELAAQYVAITQEFPPEMPKPVVLTLAADHGVAREGVSAYPSSVTAQMVMNFLNGGAAVNVLAKQVGAQVRVVDMVLILILGIFPAC
jgi:nicotinate-nucleotide--dimethylbenzimidazole phosphoribosyltransferase